MGIFENPVVSNSLVVAAWAVFWHVWHGVGITLGYHRLLTHKSLVVPKWLEYFICSGAYLALMGAPIVWVGVHRQHHQKSDTPLDPHSPRQGVAHALYKWMFYTDRVQSNEELQKQAHDLMQDKVYRVLGYDHGAYHAKLNLAICLAFRGLLWLVFGWQCALGSLIGTFTIFWSTQFVNAFCHLPSLGYRTYRTTEDSRNVWWVGILAVGEGWHNNHHAIPKSARHGLEWWEFDFTYVCIWTLEKLGLATKVHIPSKELLEKKKEKATAKAQYKMPAAVTHAAEAAQKAAEIAREAVHEAAEAAFLAAEAAGKSAREAADAAMQAAREAAEHANKAYHEAALAAGKTANEAAEAANKAAREALETAEIAIAQLVPAKETVHS